MGNLQDDLCAHIINSNSTKKSNWTILKNTKSEMLLEFDPRVLKGCIDDMFGFSSNLFCIDIPLKSPQRYIACPLLHANFPRRNRPMRKLRLVPHGTKPDG